MYFYLDSNPSKNPEIAFSYSPILERLSLYQTNLESLPLGRINSRMTKLIISDNPINFTPDFPRYFPKLEYLDVSHTNLYSTESCLPLCSLKSLKYLSLDDCKMKNLPPEIVELEKLREISFIKNDLSSFPYEFYTMKLKLINLKENPFSFEEKEKLNSAFKKTTIHY